MADFSSLLGAAGIGGAIGKAIVSLELETTKYQAELKAAQSQTAAGTSTMGNSFSKFGGLAQTALLGVGAAAVAGIAVAIKAGSDLNEQLNKTRVVFEDAADEVIAFSETTAQSLGIAQAEALTAAGNFGQLFQAAGFAADAAAGMSTKMVTLSADLGSFNNIPVAEALEKIRSGLAGEAEPLRQLGVFLSEAAVEAEAFSSGIAKQGAELTDAQKIQARYNIILDSTTKAQGDFNRTLGESLPNQLKVLKAELTDTAAQVGTALLPIMLELAKVALDLVNTFEPLLDLLSKAGPVVNLLGQAFSFMLSPLLKVLQALDELVGGFEPTQEMVDLMGEAALAVIAMDDAVGDAGKGLGNFRGRFFQAQLAAEGATGGVLDFTHKTINGMQKWRTEVGESIDGYIFDLKNLSHRVELTKEDFVEGMRAMADRARKMADALLAIKEEDWINPRFIEFLGKQGPEAMVTFAKLNEEKQHAMQQLWKQTTEDTDEAHGSVRKMIDTLDNLDKGTSKHTVLIEYEYVGFDPSKPGMNVSRPVP